MKILQVINQGENVLLPEVTKGIYFFLKKKIIIQNKYKYCKIYKCKYLFIDMTAQEQVELQQRIQQQQQEQQQQQHQQQQDQQQQQQQPVEGLY